MSGKMVPEVPTGKEVGRRWEAGRRGVPGSKHWKQEADPETTGCCPVLPF